MSRIQCTYTGDLRCEAQHELSGTRLQTDAPPDHDGLGTSFSPTDLVATALGTCILTVMGITARRRGWVLGTPQADVEKIMSNEGPRRIETLRVHLFLPEALSDDQKKLLKRVVNDCPVKRNLEPSITIDLIWNEAGSRNAEPS